MSDSPTLLRELIDIPERVQTNDFVLKLAEGVSDAEAATITSYVIAPQLARAFDHALGFIQGAVEGHHGEDRHAGDHRAAAHGLAAELAAHAAPDHEGDQRRYQGGHEKVRRHGLSLE